MTRVDIVGLTLAEIALALLFCFVAVFAPAYARVARELKQTPDPKRLKTLELKVQELESKVQELLAENDRLKRSIPGARSKQTPSCTEIGKAVGPLFTTTIHGEDRYELDGAFLTLQMLRTQFAEALAEAKSNQCVQSIRVYFGSEVSVQEYDSALRRIEQLFYVGKLGQLRQ